MSICDRLKKDVGAEKLQELIDETRARKAEVGTSICENADKKLSLQPICVGDHCSVSIRRYCPPETYFVGTIHTHGKQLVEPSTSDFRAADWHDERVICVLNDEHKLACYEGDSYELGSIAGQITALQSTDEFNECLNKFVERQPSIKGETPWAKIVQLDTNEKIPDEIGWAAYEKCILPNYKKLNLGNIKKCETTV